MATSLRQQVELVLLCSSLSASPVAPALEHADAGDCITALELLQLVQQGNFLAVLTHPSVVALLKPSTSAAQDTPSPASFYSWLQTHAATTIASAEPSTQLTWLIAGVAAYTAFLQENLTGPSIATSLGAPCWLYGGIEDQQKGSQGTGQDTLSLGDEAAMKLLQVDGEDLQGKVVGLQWLLLALLLLLEPLAAPDWRSTDQASNRRTLMDVGRATVVLSQLPSWSWWALRTVSLHQHLLSGRSATLLLLCSELSQRTLAWVEAAAWQPALQQARICLPPSWLRAAACLEAAHVQHQYLHVDAAHRLLQAAGAALHVSVQVTGALGKRTVHQVDPKAQLVVVKAGGGPAGAAVEGRQQQDATPATDGCVEVAALCLDEVSLTAELQGMEDHSDVFMAPDMLDAQGPSTSHSALEQALLLAWAQQVKKGSAADELQPWQMAPYVEAVLLHKRSCYLLQLAARLLKARHEFTRTRTKERALVHLERVAEAWSHPQPAAGLRLPLAAATWFPLRPLMRKELGEAYLSMGLVGAALKIFESLEMWEHLIVCYRMLDKKMLADTLIQQRLQVTPDDPKLWCALGDLHLEDSHYETAWERSGRRHARSQRALGRSAVRQKDYARAAKHYELGLALSPLYPEAWFSLGYAYLKLDQFSKALTAFTRVTQMDPEHGEAWNNVAALLLQTDRFRQAFTALTETVKHKREDWRIWENYAHAAVKSGHLLPCVNGLLKVHSLTSGKQLSLDVLDLLMSATEKLTRPEPSSDEADTDTDPDATTATADEEAADTDDAFSLPTVDAVAFALSQTLGLAAHQPDGSSGDGSSGEGRSGEGRSGDGSSGEGRSGEGRSGDGSRGEGRSGEGRNGEGRSGESVRLAGGAQDAAGPPTTSEATTPPSAPANGSINGSAAAAAAATSTAPSTSTPADAGGSSKAVQLAAKQRQHEQQRVLAALKGLLTAAANSAVAKPRLWGIMARFYELQGETVSVQESLVKQVRSLQTSSFRSDPEAFHSMGTAMKMLCTHYMAAHRTGQAKLKDLASSRMQLSSFLKQTQEHFEQQELHGELRGVLTQLQASEAEAQSAAAR